MLSTIREFGLEQLAASHLEETARQRHADWCLALAQRAEPEFGRGDVIKWLDRLEQEHDNVRAALSWLLEHGAAEQSMQLILAFWMFWFYRSYFKEARMWIERVLAQLSSDSTTLRAHALRIAGLFSESLGDFPIATAYVDESLRIATELDDPETTAMALLVLGDIVDNQGDYDRAEPLLWRAIEIFREIGDHIWMVTTLAFLGLLVHRRGEDEMAESLVNEALELSRERGFIWGTAMCLNRLGRIESYRADYPRATQLYAESLKIWSELGDNWRMTRVLVDLADVASAHEQYERAVRLLGAADALNEPLGVSESFTDDSARLRALTPAVERLDPGAFADAWAVGRAMSWDDAIAEAIEPISLAVAPFTESPGPTDRYGLTAREMEVLQLIVAGHTDRQIAEELFISRRTAQGHVASIFNKLGVNSRTAAATAALRDGLANPEPSLS